ncbi:MAG: lipoyl synthase, partial [Candidatus Zixiibacteriota bacterium]
MHKIFDAQAADPYSASSPSPKAPPKSVRAQIPHARLPRWLKVTGAHGPNYARVRSILKQSKLHSVCQEAACPNIRECFNEGTATFKILGNRCTRGCNFCDVTKAKPLDLDTEEPARLARVVADLKLRQVVITSV